jgi:hypothetical protein
MPRQRLVRWTTHRRPRLSIHSDPIPVDGIRGLLDVFTTYPRVALGEAHWLQQEADFVAHLIRHPLFHRTVPIIVVEFGNAYYQPMIDRFITGESITDTELRRVWRNVGGAGHAFESPIYAQFFHSVRALNQTLPPVQHLRVLLGDPPIDGQTGQRNPAMWSGLNPRDAYYAMVVERHILAHGQRALLIAGGGHFTRISDAAAHEGNVVQRLELKYPGTVFVVLPHVIFDETMAVRQDEVLDLETRLAAWPIPALATIRGTWLGELDAYLHCDNVAQIIESDGSERLVRVPYIGPDGVPVSEVRLSEMVDALLYLGPQHRLTFTPPARRPRII